MISLRLFQNKQWIKNWSGNWSVLSCSCFGGAYTKGLKKFIGTSFDHALFIFHKEQNFCYFMSKDAARFGKALAKKAVEEKNFIPKIAKGLTEQTGKILQFIKRNSKKTIDQNVFTQFQNIHAKYIQYHVSIKWVVNYLSPEQTKKYFPFLEKARVISEPVYKHYEEFIQRFAGGLEKQLGYPRNLIKALTKNELENFWENKRLPPPTVLKSRYQKSALYYFKGIGQILNKQAVEQIKNLIEKSYTNEKVIKGIAVFPGKVKGKVRIVFNPKKQTIFKKGEILVTGMTRPEYFPLMERAAGFITDAGGLLSHAAITAREFKKPCIVGTEIATKFFKTGNIVEMDANNGTIKKLWD